MTNGELKEFLLNKYGYICDECGKPSTCLDLHHFLIHDQRKHHSFLTSNLNCGIVCLKCHQGIVNGHESRVRFLEKQLTRHQPTLLYRYFTQAKFNKDLVVEAWVFDMIELSLRYDKGG